LCLAQAIVATEPSGVPMFAFFSAKNSGRWDGRACPCLLPLTQTGGNAELDIRRLQNKAQQRTEPAGLAVLARTMLIQPS
jgi:hypothetical protein